MRGNMSWLTKYICSGKRADPPYMIIGYHEGQGGTSDLNANFICFTAFRFAPVSAWNTLNAPVKGEERRAPSSVSAQQPIPSQSSRPCFFFCLKKNPSAVVWYHQTLEQSAFHLLSQHQRICITARAAKGTEPREARFDSEASVGFMHPWEGAVKRVLHNNS